MGSQDTQTDMNFEFYLRQCTFRAAIQRLPLSVAVACYTLQRYIKTSTHPI